MTKIEEAFRSYVAEAFTGENNNPEDFIDQFNSIYHDDYIHEMDGRRANKEQMREIHASHIELGSRVTILYFKYTSLTEVEFCIHIVNEQEDVRFVNHVTIKDGKLHYGCAADGESMNSVKKTRCVSDFYQVERNARQLFSVFKTNARSGDKFNQKFDELYHKDFVFSMDKNKSPLTKADWKETVQKGGFEIDLLEFKPQDSSHFEAKVHFTKANNEWDGHSIGTVRDGKLIRLEPFDEESKPAYQKLLVPNE